MATIFAPALGDMLEVFLEAENLGLQKAKAVCNKIWATYLYIKLRCGKINFGPVRNQPSFGAACCLSYIRVVSGDRTRQKRNTNAFYTKEKSISPYSRNRLVSVFAAPPSC